MRARSSTARTLHNFTLEKTPSRQARAPVISSFEQLCNQSYLAVLHDIWKLHFTHSAMVSKPSSKVVNNIAI
jgi:hypothetical protein